MSNTIVEDLEFKSALFSPEPYSDEGEADGLPTLSEVGIDQELQHRNWQAEKAGRQLVGLESEGVDSYGYTVYRDLLEEDELPDAVYLDPRCFLRETNLIDVLEAAANVAIDYEEIRMIAPIVKGMIHTAQSSHFSGDKMRKYMPTVMRSADINSIQPYVDFINGNTLKGLEESRDILKEMAHAVQALPEKGVHRDDPGLRRLDKQILLENIGQAWIRKGMPIAEIDWLP